MGISTTVALRADVQILAGVHWRLVAFSATPPAVMISTATRATTAVRSMISGITSPSPKNEANRASPLASVTPITTASAIPIDAGRSTRRAAARRSVPTIDCAPRTATTGAAIKPTPPRRSRSRKPAALSPSPALRWIDNPTANTTTAAIASGTSNQALDRIVSQGATQIALPTITNPVRRSAPIAFVTPNAVTTIARAMPALAGGWSRPIAAATAPAITVDLTARRTPGDGPIGDTGAPSTDRAGINGAGQVVSLDIERLFHADRRRRGRVSAGPGCQIGTRSATLST
jgi:hypothetical protein